MANVFENHFRCLANDDGITTDITVQIPSQSPLRNRDRGLRTELTVLNRQGYIGFSNFDPDDIGRIPSELRFRLQRICPIRRTRTLPCYLDRFSPLAGDIEIVSSPRSKFSATAAASYVICPRATTWVSVALVSIAVAPL